LEDVNLSSLNVSDYYTGFYTDFLPDTKAGLRFLAGLDGVIGGQLISQAEGVSRVAEKGATVIVPADAKAEDGDSATDPGDDVSTAGGDDKASSDTRHSDVREILNSENVVVGSIRGSSVRRLNELESRGWQVRCYLALTTIDGATKRLGAHIACMAYNADPELGYEQTFLTFCKNIALRIGTGERPSLSLGSKQLTQVLESKGYWYLTKVEKRPVLPKGTQVYKSRRTLTENLADYGNRHRTGCSIAATVFWVALIGLIVWGIVSWIR
jgi:hypothetical protein